jgi:prevent-host-death family protein
MQVNMLEAKNRLSSLIVAAEQGEEVVIARNGIPVAKIVKYDAPQIKPPGAWRDMVAHSTDWNSAQTNTEVERLFPEDGDDALSA